MCTKPVNHMLPFTFNKGFASLCDVYRSIEAPLLRWICLGAISDVAGKGAWAESFTAPLTNSIASAVSMYTAGIYMAPQHM